MSFWDDPNDDDWDDYEAEHLADDVLSTYDDDACPECQRFSCTCDMPEEDGWGALDELDDEWDTEDTDTRTPLRRRDLSDW